MRTSAAGRALIEQREGRRLTAYRDTQGVLTIGVGHTGRMSPPSVMPKMTITDAQCDAMLAADLAPVEAALGAALKVPVSQAEFDAMASLGFNIGAPALKLSSVLRRLNSGDVAGAADAFLLWDRPAVLLGRRKAERAQFLAGDSRAAGTTAARAATLSTRASAAGAKAKASRSGAAALATAGGVTLAAAHAHHHVAALAALTLMALAAAAAIAAALWHRAAQTLAANAGKQAPAAALGTPSSNLADTLQR